MIQAGKRIEARGTIGALGKTSKGNPQVAVELEILSGPDAGHTITWYGYFTDDTTQRTIESLRHLGWKGDNLSVLKGIDANVVSIEIGHEEYMGETQPKVRWINATGGLAMKETMDAAEALQFARSMKGAVVQANAAAKAKLGGAAAAPESDAKKPAAAAPRNGTQGKPPAHAPSAPDFGDDDIPF